MHLKKLEKSYIVDLKSLYSNGKLNQDKLRRYIFKLATVLNSDKLESRKKKKALIKRYEIRIGLLINYLPKQLDRQI